ncbi:MAG TPA: STAS domain-containing protein [Anaerolineae bacterium]
MSFSVTTKELKRVDLVQVTGRVDSATAPQLEQALQKTIDAGRYNIVVDLADAEYMSSAALRALISAQKQVKHGMRSGDVRIANMPDRIRKAFELAGFLELFQIHESEADAVGSF